MSYMTELTPRDPRTGADYRLLRRKIIGESVNLLTSVITFVLSIYLLSTAHLPLYGTVLVVLAGLVILVGGIFEIRTLLNLRRRLRAIKALARQGFDPVDPNDMKF